MTSFLPLMQLLPFDDISLHRLRHFFDLHVSVSCCKPFPTCRGHLGIFVSHILPYYCIGPDDYSRHRMYVGSIMLFIWLMFWPAHASLLHSGVFWVPYSLYSCLSGHRYASTATFNTGTASSTRDLFHLQVSSPQGLVL